MDNAHATYPSLKGRAVFISGGATGIGATLVREFTAQGSRVAFIDIEVQAAETLAAGLAKEFPNAPMFLHCDVTDTAALREAIKTVEARLGAIHVLVNNAANDRRHKLEETSPEIWDASVAVNLRHQFFAAQAVAGGMRKSGGGSIVNFGSFSWMAKTAGMPAYTASKAAVQGLTRCLALELGPYNIRVNTLVPGWVMTEKQMRLWVDAAAVRQIEAGQCLKGRVQPEDIARMALFLAADDSRMCTGHDYIVDGGWV
jgi:NAD(P)-dependent dehydrogenase (short-subunit alcohol dehydrogenase family)